MAFDPLPGESQTANASIPKPPHRFAARADAIVDWFKTLASAAVYATLLLTFVGQIARVDGLSMEPTLADHDRLVVNKWIYRFSEPRPGDIVMLYYPINPEKSFVKRVIAREGDQVRITSGKGLRQRRGAPGRVRTARGPKPRGLRARRSCRKATTS